MKDQVPLPEEIEILGIKVSREAFRRLVKAGQFNLAKTKAMEGSMFPPTDRDALAFTHELAAHYRELI